MQSALFMDTPIGPLGITEDNGRLTGVFFSKGARLPKGHIVQATPLLRNVRDQLAAYFAGTARAFNVPVDLRGTPFQVAVWQELLNIPAGATRSYHDVAAALGKPTATRAVGGAVHCNPIVIIVPCHRVIGKDGSLTGFAGGLETKRLLLEHEARHWGKGETPAS